MGRLHAAVVMVVISLCCTHVSSSQPCSSNSDCDYCKIIPSLSVHQCVGGYFANTCQYDIRNQWGYWEYRPCPDRCNAQPGWFCNINNNLQICPAGQFCTGGYSISTNCSAGTYCNKTGMSAPVMCIAGSFCDTPGLTWPTTCPRGQYCPYNQSTAPIPCPSGSFCPSNGLTQPLPCPVGTYCQTTGLTTPTICPKGQYCPYNQSTAPIMCAPGSFCPTEGLNQSLPCPPDTYCQTSGLIQPNICLKGLYCPYNTSLCPDNSRYNVSLSACTANVGYFALASTVNLLRACGPNVNQRCRTTDQARTPTWASYTDVCTSYSSSCGNDDVLGTFAEGSKWPSTVTDAWWVADLERVYSVNSLYFRTRDCCNGNFQSVDVLVSMSNITDWTATASLVYLTVPASAAVNADLTSNRFNAYGKYIYAHKYVSTGLYAIDVNEIRAYGPANANFVPCADTCTPQNTTKRCNSAGVTVCCGAGQYFVEGVSSTCQSCAAGTFSPNGSMTTCSQCPVNSTSSVGLAYCNCSVPRFKHNTTSNTCVALPCPAGTINSSTVPANGGTPNIDVLGYNVHSFTSGTTNIYFSQSTTVDILVIGGGGSGGSNVGAGGGAGAVIFYPGYVISAGSYDVTVGLGGTAPSANGLGTSGSASSIGSLFTATGGGGAGWFQSLNGLFGGSGGGAAAPTGGSSTGTGGAIGVSNIVDGVTERDPSNSVYVFENIGGNATYPRYPGDLRDMTAAGGGGAGFSGANNNIVSPYLGGAGGDGICNVSIQGTTYVFSGMFGSAYTNIAQSVGGLYYVAGGGGGGGCGNYGGLYDTSAGGKGGGGIGATQNNNYCTGSCRARLSGLANTGSGGGGTGGNAGTTGGNGGSGLVLIRYVMCPQCRSGTYSGSDGSSGCLQCDVGTYSPAGSSSCLACPNNSFSTVGSSACITNAGYYYPMAVTITHGGSAATTSPVPGTIGQQYFRFTATSGTNNITFPVNVTARVLVVGGGGSGGVRHAGGGGAGALVHLARVQLTAGTQYTITVGAGGSAPLSSSVGNDGSDSSIKTASTYIVLAKGGGGGGCNSAGRIGGSSGGGSTSSTQIMQPLTSNLPSGTSGYAGGAGSDYNANSCGGGEKCWCGAGGGGAGGVGVDVIAGSSSSSCIAGAAGPGISVDITGSSVVYAAGGGGGANPYGAAGAGGVGGAGGLGIVAAAAGTANTGSGGGGSGFNGGTNGAAGAGGNGVVIIVFDGYAACPNNSWSAPGAVICTANAGYTMVASGASAISCPAGSYCPSTGIKPCPRGSYCNFEGMITPQPCPAGFYCQNESLTQPSACLPGYYCNTSGLSLPVLCPYGFYCSTPQTIILIPCYTESDCEPGSMSPCYADFYFNSSTRTCLACPNQTTSFQNSLQCTKCTVCQTWQYTSRKCEKGLDAICKNCSNTVVCPFNRTLISRCNATSDDICPLCLPGSYPTAANNLKCGICPAGSYCLPDKTPVPVICPPNSYSPPGSSGCLPCKTGSYALTPGSYICTPTTPSTQSNLTCSICPAGSMCVGTTPPKLCPPGSYSAYGASQCTICSNGTYAVRPGSATCTLCSSGNNASSPMNATSSSQCFCVGRFYATFP